MPLHFRRRNLICGGNRVSHQNAAANAKRFAPLLKIRYFHGRVEAQRRGQI